MSKERWRLGRGGRRSESYPLKKGEECSREEVSNRVRQV